MEMSLPCKCIPVFGKREPRTPALIVLIDVICYVACSRRRVNKAALKRHGMSQRSFIRSFHLFVRSFILSFFFISFVRIGRSFILFTIVVRSFRSFMSFVCSCVSFVSFVRSRFIHLFFLRSSRFAVDFYFLPFFPNSILSLEHLSLSSSSYSEFSTSERQSEESFATCKVYLRNYTSLNCFANPSK